MKHQWDRPSFFVACLFESGSRPSDPSMDQGPVSRENGGMNDAFRIETDTMGEMRVPSSALYGAQTARALENFPISGRRFPRSFIRALGLIKSAAAQVNGRPEIERAAEAVAEGWHDSEFPVDIFQTGSGTSTNMNANEVIGRLASAH